jgi:hypothetical protein
MVVNVRIVKKATMTIIMPNTLVRDHMILRLLLNRLTLDDALDLHSIMQLTMHRLALDLVGI